MENNAFMTPRQKSISTISLTMGNKPAWCTPSPLLNSSRTLSTCGNLRSPGLSRLKHRSQKTCMSCFSAVVVRSRPVSESTIASMRRRENANVTIGRSSRLSSARMSSTHAFLSRPRAPELMPPDAPPPLPPRPPNPPPRPGCLLPELPVGLEAPRPKPRPKPPRPAAGPPPPPESFFLLLLSASTALLYPAGRKVSLSPTLWKSLSLSPPKYSTCSSGTGLLLVPVTNTFLRLVRPTQSANSQTLGTVALSSTKPTCSGSMMITSSHTTPRSASFT